LAISVDKWFVVIVIVTRYSAATSSGCSLIVELLLRAIAGCNNTPAQISPVISGGRHWNIQYDI